MIGYGEQRFDAFGVQEAEQQDVCAEQRQGPEIKKLIEGWKLESRPSVGVEEEREKEQ